MQTVSTDQLVGQTVGHYNVKSLLGRGRLSAVYLAQHPTQSAAVALTTFIIPERFSAETRTRFTQRFTREAAALTALSHRNLLPIYEYGEQFGYPYLITPYMTHGSLADILKRQGRCTPTYALEVLEQVAAGLDYAHRKGIVHGTLKPANILLSTDQNLLVAGFGLIHMLQMRGIEQNDQPYSYLLSIADTFLYASTYIAPEVVQGQPIDPRSDIYALGVILFELLSGTPPFAGSSPLDTAMQHLQRPLPSLHQISPDIPISMELVINHALARDPSQRFQRVSELVEAFAQVCKGIVNRPHSTQSNEAAFLLDEPKAVQNLQNVPEEEVSIGGWQLTPPIVTGKLLTPRALAGNNVVSAQATPAKPLSPDGWQILPPIVTGRMASVRPSQPMPTAKPVVPPAVAPAPAISFLQQPAQRDVAARTHEQPQPVQYKQEAQAAPPVSPLPIAPTVGKDDLMNTPTWWIQAPSVAPAPSMKAQEASLRLPNQEQKKSMAQNKQVPPSDDGMRIRPAKRPRNVGRRRVIATIAAGSVVAAGALIAGKMNLAHLVTQLNTHTAQGDTTAAGQQKPTGTPGTPKGGTTPGTTGTPKGGTNPGNTGTAPTGKVLGATSLTANTAMDIVNPADGKAGLLIHLPNGHFAAYERACTHEGVEVNYDPMTHTLVCPAHGAVFDPLNKAAVLQGPATRPLASVAFRVNADGTITAG